ncbi:hypothetical protein ACFYQT_39785 [Streptomyces tibetensis]|uniref:Uncharacterized protein n=1 Tax=Streptomyces tibetensis TaxID=2382123 RepID=A0ABW6NAV0_9ACTN
MPATAVRTTPAYPRPPIAHEYRELFREPVYTDGQTYTDDEDEDDEGW